MGRPRKTGLNYFPLDVDFFQDEKMVAIHGEFGLKGEITAIHLLCAVYRNGYFVEWTEMQRLKLAKELGLSSGLVEQIVQRLAKWGFFDENLLCRERVLSSQGIQQRYFSAVSRRRGELEYPYLLVPNINNEFMYTETGVSVGKKCINKSKYKESPYGDKKGQPSSVTPNVKGVSEMVAELKQDEMWLDQMQVSTGHSVDELKGLLDIFKGDCVCRAKVHPDLDEVKRHFCNWLPVHIRYERQEKLSNNEQQGKVSVGNNFTGKGKGRYERQEAVLQRIGEKLSGG